MKLRTLAILAALAALVVVAGCGGGDDSSTSSSTTAAAALTKEEFIAQADQICTDGDAAIQAAQPDFGPSGPSEDDLNAFVTDTLVPNLQSQHDAIAALGAPEGDEDTVSSLLDQLQSAIDGVKADPSSVASGTDTFADVNQAAQDYGLKKCGAS
jgi:hypothetical protein